jgi:uncharacterized protein DUF4136
MSIMRTYLPSKSLWTVAVIILMVASSCESSLKVTSDFDKSVNFSEYKTFSLYHDSKSAEAISQLNQDRVVNAIRSEMTKRGFTEASSSPDLLVNSVAIFKDKVSVSSNTNYYGYGGYYRPYYGGMGMASSSTNYNVQHYKDGSLIIDIVDSKTNKLIWQGIGNKEIDKPAKDPDTAIPKAIASIMASFPPGSKSKK